MTIGDYKDCLKAWGLTRRKQSYEGASLYEDRDGQFTTIPDPEGLSPDERVDFIRILKIRMGIAGH